MKKTTFIVMATAVVMLTGCAGVKTPGDVQKDAENNNSMIIIQQKNDLEAKDAEIVKLEEENESLKDRIAELEAEREETSENPETDAQAETSLVVENAGTEKVPLIPKDQENICVSALYHGKEIPLFVATEEKRAESINNANVITVKDANGKDVKDRDLSIMIDGVSVANVYLVDKEFKKVEDLSYDGVDNTYKAYYYMPIGGQYTFLIQTTNGTHYYVTVEY